MPFGSVSAGSEHRDAWHAAWWRDGLLNCFDRPKARTMLRAFFY
jgi:hypothetical protein